MSIQISPELIKPRERASETAFIIPSGALLTWLEVVDDPLPESASAVIEEHFWDLAS